MITGIDHPTAGSVRVGDNLLHHMNESQMAVWRGRNLGIVFQFFQLLPTLTVLENILLPMDFANHTPPAAREARATDLLELMGLEDAANKLPAALSGGQQQIAAIARALANDPPIIIADEPTGNLDSRTADRVLQIFETLADQGKTILIVTHDPNLARRSTRRVLISDGELIHDRVADALEGIPHPQMLKITKMGVNHTYEPGATIARQGAIDEGLYVILRGQVDILQEHGRSKEVLGRLEAGQYFSELELVETPFCDLTYRAGYGEPVEVLTMTLGNFNQLLGESPAMENTLRHAARQRSQHFCPKRSAERAIEPKPTRPSSRWLAWLRRKKG
jgi:ABC-type lipoprotein export system ATPase subunit